MIRETICMYALWVLLKLFGQECFAVSAVCTLPDPALKVLSEYETYDRKLVYRVNK